MIKHARAAAAAEPSEPLSLGVPEVLPRWTFHRTGPAPAVVPVPQERVAGIDLLRIMAVVGIVWFHTEGAPHREIGYAGLPVFLLIFFSLVARPSPARGTAQFIGRRWQRLLKPWLFWSLVYGSCKLANAAATADWRPLHEILSVPTLFIGTSIHLWYLPYAFVLGLVLHVLNRRLATVNPAAVAVAAAAVGVVTLAASAVDLTGRAATPPLPQWEFGLATLGLGLAVGRSLAVPSRRVQVWLLLLISGATIGVSALLLARGFGSNAIPYSLAVPLVCLAYLCPLQSNAFIRTTAPLTFGIYLIHPLVLYGLTHSLLRSGPAGPFTDAHYAVAIALTTCLAAALTWALTKTPLGWVV